MVEMVKNKIEKMIKFLNDEKGKIKYKEACDLLNGYLIALKDFYLITFEEATDVISKFCFDYLEASKEEK